ncbi:SGNH/GDSL hydrolase family protein [Paenibacillus harenae]|uniref:SGNH/GDSL hydrolase family protein n=1 Tax=Paenibacillus harenae TaxID=306543 RepID=UPI0027903C9C|nr:SGNH/GDSL hydrolase family protein [Paenibacillus harenae]MDQ0063444.1 lysophospholipase L1-like esterase [Paenibacillus harenae]
MEQRKEPYINEEEAAATGFDMKAHARYTGRLDWSDSAGPLLAWAGSSITVRFQGSSANMRLAAVERNDTWVDVTVDGGEPRKYYIDESGHALNIATGLGDGSHTLVIRKRTEAMFGTVRFLGIELPEGGLFLKPPPRKARRIELIGDSISAGSGNEGKDGDPNIAEHENNGKAYGTLAAEALDAEMHTTAVSGIGLIVNYGDERVNTMTAQYERLNALHAEPKWDFAEWTADVVVINLGTNDSKYELDRAQFVSAYEAFVARIRSYYPEAHIFMTLGPFRSSPVKEYISEAYDRIHAAGDAKVHHFLFDEANRERDGMGETGHPTVITHALMAGQLTQQIKHKLGW